MEKSDFYINLLNVEYVDFSFGLCLNGEENEKKKGKPPSRFPITNFSLECLPACSCIILPFNYFSDGVYI